MSGDKDQSRRKSTEAAAADGPKGRRLLLIVIAGALLIGGPLLVALQLKPQPHAAAGAVGGPFKLVDQDGRTADQTRLLGRWSAVFFGYTYCPDVCPATLQMLGAAARRLGPAARDFQVVFITVDPARDTPEALRRYLKAQDLPVPALGLTGSPDEIARAAKAYRVYYAKSGSGADYTMDHSAAIYLMDPMGRFRRPLAPNMTPALAADQIAATEKEP